MKLLRGGKSVEFVAGEKVSCDGFVFKHFTAAFGRDVLTTSIAGRTVKWVYTSSRQSTAFDFSVPNQLEIVMPRNHERARRGPQTTITFNERASSASLSVIAYSTGWASAPLEAITMTRAVLDTSSLKAGNGFIEITEPCFSIDVQGDQFQSVGGYECSTAIVNVVWV